MDHHFTGPRYTLGIEEELMILDAETLQLASAMDRLLGDPDVGAVKPELHESVLEISTDVCADIREASSQLRALRTQVRERAEGHGLTVASSGTHPFARWEDQRISPRERYRELISDIGFVARQELIFGLHVHVGLDDPELAVHVANGMRVHLAPLLALSVNSPYWHGNETGLASARTPIFRQFPRVGVPPRFSGWQDWSRRIEFMIDTHVIRDHTWMWYDVRIHPTFGTVETRVMDAQTRVEHTLALAALIQAMVRELAEQFDAGEPDTAVPYEMLDENKWLAARHGLSGELVDLPGRHRAGAHALVERLLERLAPHAEALGSTEALAGVREILDNGPGAARQRMVYEANHDYRELVRELVDATAG